MDEDSRRFVSQETGHLYIAKVEPSDVGNYTCVVTSTATAARVLGAPTPLVLRSDGTPRSRGTPGGVVPDTDTGGCGGLRESPLPSCHPRVWRPNWPRDPQTPVLSTSSSSVVCGAQSRGGGALVRKTTPAMGGQWSLSHAGPAAPGAWAAATAPPALARARFGSSGSGHFVVGSKSALNKNREEIVHTTHARIWPLFTRESVPPAPRGPSSARPVLGHS